MKKALVLMICLCMLVSMMTIIPVGAAWDIMYCPMESEDVLATSFYAAIDIGKYTLKDSTQKTIDLNGTVDATLSYVTPGANGTAGAVELAMVNDSSLQETVEKSDGSTGIRGQDYRPRILTKDKVTFRTGNTYKISYYIMGETNANVNLWMNTGRKIAFEGETMSTTTPAYRDLGQVKCTNEWKYVEREFKVTGIQTSGGVDEEAATMELGLRATTNFPTGYFRIDEFKVELTDKVTSASNTVSVTVGANGSVTKDGAAVPASFKAEIGSTVTLNLVPDAKYIAKAKVNGADYAVTNNQVTLTVTEDTTVEVTFERIPDVTPGFAGDGSSYTWFKTVDGKATIFSYHKLSAFNTGETDLGYGIKLWKTADPENKVILPAYDPATNQPAKAVPGAMFAIRVYGDAITADQSYTILPFVGTVTGSETAPDFE